MTIGAWLFGVGLALLAGWFIAGPLVWQGGPAASPRIGSQRLQMLERKAALLSAIREIDADVAIGKLEPADHRTLRRRYVAEGVALLKALEALPAGDPIGLAIEADVARLRAGESVAPTSPGTCRECGAPANSIDLFCGRCGAGLKG